MPSAIILAGGLGTRLRSEVPDLPKPMAPVGGKPFLEILLEYWISQSIDRFILSVGYKHEMIIDHFKHEYRGASIDYSIEEAPLGTGGGFLAALNRLSDEEDFLLLNGDTYFSVKLEALRSFARRNDTDWCFSLFRSDEENRYMGMQINELGRVLSLKSTQDPEGVLVNGGVYWVRRSSISKEITPPIYMSLESDFFPKVMEEKLRMFGMEAHGVFIDIGVPRDYRRAPALLL